MLIIAGILIGVVWAVVHVRRRNGSRLDIAQYVTVWGLIGAILGIVLSIGLARLM